MGVAKRMATARIKEPDGWNKSRAKQHIPKTAKPLWQGPEQDGITQSLIWGFLTDRERFRVKVIEGLGMPRGFVHAIEYGSMFHLCEEHHNNGDDWEQPLLDYVQDLQKQYPTEQADIVKWYHVCRHQFPIYVDYWRKHDDIKQQKSLVQEQTFCVDYRLPSGRTVKLRGKWDGIKTVGRGKRAAVYLQENKTKGDIDEQGLKQQLAFDLQTSVYLIALREEFKYAEKTGEWLEGLVDTPTTHIGGVHYNVIRRPLSGGRHTIRPHKATKNKPAETMPEYYERLAGLMREEPEFFFMRWRVEISNADLQRFEQRCLVPLLEQICDWWDYMCMVDFDPWNKEQPVNNHHHWQEPYGAYANPVRAGRRTDLDNYVMNGNRAGLVKIDDLFPELD